MHWYVDVLKKYAVFSGRARRQEYWMFFLFNLIITIVLAIVDAALDTQVLQLVYGLAVLIPGLAVAVRRLHDTGRSGWWVLISLIPLVGFIILLVFLASEGKPEANEYGPNPKYAPAV
ncbi:DUF805 domain-containing protein [Streptomyces griseoluteus]|jgi:uncharacterized membrane protein YhaH (DUF805 family)|uniref:DUF805 domain-containing protein n=1 Tax=Streptomyces griseoluteus TaxID=29306 RepID=A0A4Z1D3B5_STRGP|nr:MULTISPECIES: DUF805 domain-containing protein [Streptomyces]TGN76128.1 DUF805 domain-containing protein [Streptomyces griseoluteus]GHE93304.1 hypothetical protein GCM10017776_07260 [Streptomyces griseoluteus]